MLTALMVLLRSIGLICGGHRAVAGKPRATSTVGRADANGETSGASFDGPTLLDPPRQGVAGVAHRLDRRAARHRGAVAPPMAPSSVDAALLTDTSGAPQHGCGGSNARRPDGRGESAVGSASDPRRIVQAGHHGVGADRVATPAATASPAVTDVANACCSCSCCSPTSVGESSISGSRSIPRQRGRPSTSLRPFRMTRHRAGS
jgi:hypothetical protein